METDKRSHRPWQTIAMGNITRVVKLKFGDDNGENGQNGGPFLAPTDPHFTDDGFVDERGFFIRSAVDAVIKYCPVGNTDEEAITKTFTASNIFVDPEICRKIFKTPTSPDAEIYIGYGV